MRVSQAQLQTEFDNIINAARASAEADMAAAAAAANVSPHETALMNLYTVHVDNLDQIERVNRQQAHARTVAAAREQEYNHITNVLGILHTDINPVTQADIENRYIARLQTELDNLPGNVQSIERYLIDLQQQIDRHTRAIAQLNAGAAAAAPGAAAAGAPGAAAAAAGRFWSRTR